MKRNGFTLVELLAVIVLLALLMTIAVPNVFKLNTKVKKKAYATKIDLIEQAADSYGQSNLSMIRTGTSIDDSTVHTLCTFEYEDDEIVSVLYESRTYSDSLSLTNTDTKKQYWCTKLTVDELVGTNNLNWDEENQCNGECDTSNEEYYDKIVVNPVNGYIINKCDIYIYYRNKRVYSYFDQKKCDNSSDVANNSGQEYRPLN